MITVIDYGAGNVRSVLKAFAYLGYVTEVTSDAGKLARASHLVLPGVGNFRATAALRRTGIHHAVREALGERRFFLGICLGMQWLFEGSEEAPGLSGCGILPGRCSRFAAEVKVPHVGWNVVRRRGESRLLRGLEAQFFAYYTHSYRALAGESTVGVTDHGEEFAGVVERGNVFGVQFHPEKSAAAGLQLLRNFASC